MIWYKPWFETRRRHRSLGDCVRKILRRKNLPDQNMWSSFPLLKREQPKEASVQTLYVHFACRPLFQSLQNLC